MASVSRTLEWPDGQNSYRRSRSSCSGSSWDESMPKVSLESQVAWKHLLHGSLSSLLPPPSLFEDNEMQLVEGRVNKGLIYFK